MGIGAGNMTPAEVLDAAADLIEEVGWWRPGLDATGGQRCALVAINRCAPNFATSKLFAQHLGLSGGWDIPEWNNWEGRTQEQVVKEMRACAADLRAAS